MLLPEEPPTETRLFKAGWNPSAKGDFLFDAEAAQSVMAAYAEHGADLMFDLEHLSLEDAAASVNFNTDAMAWSALELRNGELWAVGVRWTPEGTTRLTERRQRYVSPAFTFDASTRRIVSLVNVAITSLPATHGLQPLVAASLRATGDTMDPEQLQKIIEALGLDAGATYEDAIAAMAAIVKGAGAAATGEAATEAPETEAPETMSAGEEKPDDKELQALRAAILRDTGAPTSVQALSQVATWKASHLALETERAKLSREKAALELGERRSIVVEMQNLGIETPHTSGLATGKLCKRLLDEPLSEMRTRLAVLRKARGAKPSAAPTPAAPDASEVELTPRQMALCARRKIDPKTYAATLAALNVSGGAAQEG